MTRRTERIGEQLRAALAELLHREVTDPRVGAVTLTQIDVAPDLSHAVVSWSALDVRGGVDVEAVSEGLASAAPFLRKRLAKTLTLRRMPELRFEYDPSIERGSEMINLLRELNESPGEDAAAPTDADGENR